MVILGVHEVFPLELVRRGFIVHDGGVRDLKWEISGQVMLNNYVVAIIRKAVKQYLIGTKPGMHELLEKGVGKYSGAFIYRTVLGPAILPFVGRLSSSQRF